VKTTAFAGKGLIPIEHAMKTPREKRNIIKERRKSNFSNID
jgi:hypothetical protein